jgi:hypothetical protein
MQIQIRDCLKSDYQIVFKNIVKKIKKGDKYGCDRIIIYKGKKSKFNPVYEFIIR